MHIDKAVIPKRDVIAEVHIDRLVDAGVCSEAPNQAGQQPRPRLHVSRRQTVIFFHHILCSALLIAQFGIACVVNFPTLFLLRFGHPPGSFPRACLKNSNVPSGEEFGAAGKQFFAGILADCKENCAVRGQKTRRLGVLTCFKQALILSSPCPAVVATHSAAAVSRAAFPSGQSRLIYGSFLLLKPDPVEPVDLGQTGDVQDQAVSGVHPADVVQLLWR